MASTETGLEYAAMVQDALRDVARRALTHVAERGLPGAHHFYLTFRTRADGVGISDDLLSQYPEEMTIVLQHDFRDLEVDDETFGVTLRFGGRPRRIVVPIAALTAFYDPSVQFLLRFDTDLEADAEPETGALRPDAPRAEGVRGEAPRRGIGPAAEPARLLAVDPAGDDAMDAAWDELGSVSDDAASDDAASDGAKSDDAERDDDSADEPSTASAKVVSIERFRRDR